MFIKVKAENGLCNLKGECYFSEYTPQTVLNTKEISVIHDKFIYDGKTWYVTVYMTNGKEFECEETFDSFKDALGDKFAEFNTYLTVADGYVRLLINKDNVQYVVAHDCGAEIYFRDLYSKSIIVKESIDEVAGRLV